MLFLFWDEYLKKIKYLKQYAQVIQFSLCFISKTWNKIFLVLQSVTQSSEQIYSLNNKSNIIET